MIDVWHAGLQLTLRQYDCYALDIQRVYVVQLYILLSEHNINGLPI